MKPVSLISLFLVQSLCINSQTTPQDVSVQLWADVQSEPPQIALHWLPNTTTNLYSVHRKFKNDPLWGPLVVSLGGTETTYIDTTIETGISYEYRITRHGNGYNGFGYINSGIEIPAVEFRGTIILLFDATFKVSLDFEIKRLISDLEGDGWDVIAKSFPRNASVVDIRKYLQEIYNSDPDNTKAVFILGHIPVPYSGEVNVDGHPDHSGAYPTDVYYGDINGTWSDNLVNNVTASDPRNHNVPGDGKFDQSSLPSHIELQVGRVDFFNMPAFSLDEEQLLRNYLDKDHAYRHKKFTVEHRALIDDNFGMFNGEAFAAGGWRNTSPLVSPENVFAGDYFTDMTEESYLWSYGCGGGWYQGASGIGSTDDFANGDVKTVFTMLFGSYFGDWDNTNNFLRAPLAQGLTLTNVWSGRPHWYFHHMGLGETIGFDVRISQNNNLLYHYNLAPRMVHMSFMGDPTLRNDMIAPVTELHVTLADGIVDMSWQPSPDSVIGYHIYVRDDFMSEDYVRLNDEIITGTSFTDSCILNLIFLDFMVRAVALTETPSGSYYNLSQGTTVTVLNPNPPLLYAKASFVITDGNIVSFTNQSLNAASYLWIFGDGTTSVESDPVHQFEDGNYSVMLIARNKCQEDTLILQINIMTTNISEPLLEAIDVFPNPSTGIFSFKSNRAIFGKLKVLTLTGELVFEDNNHLSGNSIDLTELPTGLYTISFETVMGRFIGKWTRF